MTKSRQDGSQPGDAKLPLEWQKAQVIAVVMASLAVPVILAVIGNSYATAQKEAERNVRYVELAVEILRTPPSKQPKQMRTWAVQILDRFSPVTLPPPAKESLATTQLQVASDATPLENLADKTDQEVLEEVRKLRLRRAGTPAGGNP